MGSVWDPGGVGTPVSYSSNMAVRAAPFRDLPRTKFMSTRAGSAEITSAVGGCSESEDRPWSATG